MDDAKIIHICDVYDALASDRPYRRAWPDEEVLQYIQEQSGHMFAPELTTFPQKETPAYLVSLFL